MEENRNSIEAEETPGSSGVMIHIVPETSRVRWNHIKDLDSFFTRMYNYHQRHGFKVIVMEEIFRLLEFGFVVWLLTFTVHCLRHSVMFGNTPPESNHTKVTLYDVVIPVRECVQNFGVVTFAVLFLAIVYFLVRCVKMTYHITQYADIKRFYKSALLIDDNCLDSITWHEIKKRIQAVQTEQQMCIDKDQLTELDIYHRILRFKNYMVAMMNKNLLPVRFNIPLFGEMVSLSHGLLYNIEFILFRGPGSPFQNNWQLNDDYTIRSNQMELAQRLSNLILWVAIVNLIMAPAIFLWQIIYFSFAYANILRKEPGALGMRTWSNYGRLYLRHFNELEHELDARLNRAYQHADKYLSSFSSPVITAVARNLIFLSGGLLMLLLTLGIYEEFVFQIEHILTIITALSAIGLICRSLIPNENLIWCPEQLMTAILAHVHYLPSDWKNQAHTPFVQNEFGYFFQFKAVYILNEICSPLITPFVLIFVFRPKAVEIVKFFRSFTVTVKGVGNVCSFAQMNVRKYGNPEWQVLNDVESSDIKRYPVENGKIELSLIRFALTNPEWRMPEGALKFMKSFRENAIKELENMNNIGTENAMATSLLSFGTLGEEYSSITTSVLNVPCTKSKLLPDSLRPQLNANASNVSSQGSDFGQMLQQNLEDPINHITRRISREAIMRSSSDHNFRKMWANKIEGRLEGPSEAVLYSIPCLRSTLATTHIDVTVAEMCLSTLYLYELHRKNKKLMEKSSSTSSRTKRDTNSKQTETTPLLGSTGS